MKADFAGYATKNNLLCSDGRIIGQNAFVVKHGENAGVISPKSVPLVWNHDHNSPDNVLGHVDLENRPDGVYCYGHFNNSELAQDAKEAVRNGDINSLSIYANHLTHSGNTVVDGKIVEVSLVLKGANPEAKIDNVLMHSDGSYVELDDEAIIYGGFELAHSDEPQENDENYIEQVLDTLNPEQSKVVYALFDKLTGEDDSDESDDAQNENESGNAPVKHADDDKEEADMPKDAETVYNSLSQEGKDLVDALIARLQEESAEHSDMEGEDMTNIFEENEEVLQHSEDLARADALLHSEEGRRATADMLQNAIRNRIPLHDAILAHAQNYGIKDINVLFPDAKTIRNTPDFYKRRTEWVDFLMNNTSHVPFSRIKSIYADITGDDARARGFTLDRNNNQRTLEEIFPVLNRTTEPQTVYKKQKLDEDDISDITSFDVIAWLQQEMRIMLDEEIARAVLVGDGRSNGSADKIKTDKIRPIAFDDDVYTIKDIGTIEMSKEKGSDFVDRVAQAFVNYQGSGTPTFFASPQLISKLMTQRDNQGRRLYRTTAELAAELRVSNVVEVPVMNGVKDTAGNELEAIVVNLADYTLGADKGGDVTLKTDFDIDYNQQKYLLKSRTSGALTLPKSAIALFAKAASTASSPAAQH